MRELNHPNVVSIYDFYQEDPEYFYMVLEFMQGGELFGRIVKKVRPCWWLWASSVSSLSLSLSTSYYMYIYLPIREGKTGWRMVVYLRRSLYAPQYTVQ